VAVFFEVAANVAANVAGVIAGLVGLGEEFSIDKYITHRYINYNE